MYEVVTHNQAAQLHSLNAYLFLYRISLKREQILVCVKTLSPPTHRDRAILNAKKTEHHHPVYMHLLGIYGMLRCASTPTYV
jgi:hypothetical protein